MPKKDLKKIASETKTMKEIESMDLTDEEKDIVHSEAKADTARKIKKAMEKKYGHHSASDGSFIDKRRNL